jgi:hypothetical protein
MFRDNRRSIAALLAITMALFMTHPLQADIWREQAKITPLDSVEGDWFGFSVVLDNDTIHVGAPFSFKSYLFRENGGDWEQTDAIPAPYAGGATWYAATCGLSDGVPLVGVAGPLGNSALLCAPAKWGWGMTPLDVPRSASAFGLFSLSTWLAFEDNLAVVGEPGEEGTGEKSGAVYVFDLSGQEIERTRLVGTDTAENDWFGAAVSLKGDRLLIGAPNDGSEAGAAYVFQRTGATWSQLARLAGSTTSADDGFGSTVAIWGDTAVVGAPFEDGGSGAAYMFRKNGIAWTQVSRLTALDNQAEEYFGNSVALDGDTLIVGAIGDNDTGEFAGAAYVFRDSGTSWTQVAKLTASDAQDSLAWGFGISLEGTRAVIGRYASNGPGSAYIFALEPDNADLNADGKVDGGDLALWQQHYDPTGEDSHWWNSGDANGDGKVDGGDLAIWQQQYDPVGSGDLDRTQHVPEPATLTLVALGAVFALRRHGRSGICLCESAEAPPPPKQHRLRRLDASAEELPA